MAPRINEWRWPGLARAIGACALVGAVLPAAAPAQAHASDKRWDQGAAFEPRPLSQPLYGTSGPFEHRVSTAHGDMYLEVHLPTAQGGEVPPSRLPTVMVMSPYQDAAVRALLSGTDLGRIGAAAFFNARGYVYVDAHVLGTGSSEGCIDVGGPAEVDATLEVIRWLGERAPWGSRRVAMLGHSYASMTALGAVTSGDERARFLRTTITSGNVVSWADNALMDGVATTPGIALGWGLYNGAFAALPTTSGSIRAYTDSHRCAAGALPHALELDTTGNMTPYWQARDYRHRVENVRVPALFVHGFNDRGNPSIALSGFFERLPSSRSVPHRLLIGQFGHMTPDNQTTHPEWQRTDFLPMVQAWLDRWLLDLPTQVESWEPVQVQDTTGQWRTEPSWPAVTGRFGQLALGPGGQLGAAAPLGATSYSEAGGSLPRSVTFTTPPLPGDLHVTGQSVLDLWVELDRPDAHIAARVSAVDAAGNAIGPVAFFGARSARHLNLMPENWFDQGEDRSPATGLPQRIPMRLSPVDIVVPRGGRLTVQVGVLLPTILGFPSSASGEPTTVTILHDAEHVSALRFFLPSEDASNYINVREPHEGEAPLTSTDAPARQVDGGGIALGEVWGRKPLNPIAVVAGRDEEACAWKAPDTSSGAPSRPGWCPPPKGG